MTSKTKLQQLHDRLALRNGDGLASNRDLRDLLAALLSEDTAGDVNLGPCQSASQPATDVDAAVADLANRAQDHMWPYSSMARTVLAELSRVRALLAETEQLHDLASRQFTGVAKRCNEQTAELQRLRALLSEQATQKQQGEGRESEALRLAKSTIEDLCLEIHDGSDRAYTRAAEMIDAINAVLDPETKS